MRNWIPKDSTTNEILIKDATGTDKGELVVETVVVRSRLVEGSFQLLEQVGKDKSELAAVPPHDARG